MAGRTPGCCCAAGAFAEAAAPLAWSRTPRKKDPDRTPNGGVPRQGRKRQGESWLHCKETLLRDPAHLLFDACVAVRQATQSAHAIRTGPPVASLGEGVCVPQWTAGTEGQSIGDTLAGGTRLLAGRRLPIPRCDLRGQGDMQGVSGCHHPFRAAV